MKVVAVSGPSCCGKSTLVKHLQLVLPHSAVIFQDDFYFPDAQIPESDGLANWDCPEAFDMNRLAAFLAHAREKGELPQEFDSIEAKNDLNSKIDEDKLAELREQSRNIEPVVLVDGIMLYQKESPVLNELDVRVLLTGDHDTLKARREARSGYVTIDGFWEDPPGYFDKIVWPEYQRNYGYLEDVKVAKQLGILQPPKGTIYDTLKWTLDLLAQNS